MAYYSLALLHISVYCTSILVLYRYIPVGLYTVCIGRVATRVCSEFVYEYGISLLLYGTTVLFPYDGVSIVPTCISYSAVIVHRSDGEEEEKGEEDEGRERGRLDS